MKCPVSVTFYFHSVKSSAAQQTTIYPCYIKISKLEKVFSYTGKPICKSKFGWLKLQQMLLYPWLPPQAKTVIIHHVARKSYFHLVSMETVKKQ